MSYGTDRHMRIPCQVFPLNCSQLQVALVNMAYLEQQTVHAECCNDLWLAKEEEENDNGDEVIGAHLYDSTASFACSQQQRKQRKYPRWIGSNSNPIPGCHMFQATNHTVVHSNFIILSAQSGLCSPFTEMGIDGYAKSSPNVVHVMKLQLSYHMSQTVPATKKCLEGGAQCPELSNQRCQPLKLTKETLIRV